MTLVTSHTTTICFRGSPLPTPNADVNSGWSLRVEFLENSPTFPDRRAFTLLGTLGV